MRISVAVRNSSAAVAAVILLMCTASYGQGWSGAVAIDNGGAVPLSDGTKDPGASPDAAFDGSGNAVAVFRQSDGTANRLYANRWDGTAWSGMEQIDGGVSANSADIGKKPRVAVEGSGNAVVVFDQYDGVEGQHGLLRRVYASRYDGVRWSVGTAIDNEAAPISGSYGSWDPIITAGGDGGAVLFTNRWGASGSYTHSVICANWWDGTGWRGAGDIGIRAGMSKEITPAVAIGSGGHAVAVFSRTIMTGDYQLYINRWDGTRWTGVVLIDDGVDGNIGNPKVGIDGSGKAVVVFDAPDKIKPDLDRLYATRWNGAEWTVPEVIDAGTGCSSFQSSGRIGVDESGKAVVVFGAKTNDRSRVYANRWDGTAWTGAVLIDAGPVRIPPGESTTAYQYMNPDVAVNASGEAIALFTHSDGSARKRIYANRWNGTAWTGAVLVDGGPFENLNARVAIDGSGNAMVVFAQKQFGSVRNEQVYANYFNATGIAPTETPAPVEPTATPEPTEQPIEPTATPESEPTEAHCMNLRVLNTLSGSAVTVAWSCNFTECDYAGVPVNVYLAAVSDSTVQRGTCSLEDLMKSRAVYLFNPEMRGVYRYKGGVKAPTFKGVVFGEGFESGEIMLWAPEGVLFRLAVVLVRTDTGELIGSDGSPVENSNVFIRLGAAMICAK